VNTYPATLVEVRFGEHVLSSENFNDTRGDLITDLIILNRHAQVARANVKRGGKADLRKAQEDLDVICEILDKLLTPPTK
jgi:hypothetical protein